MPRRRNPRWKPTPPGPKWPANKLAAFLNRVKYQGHAQWTYVNFSGDLNVLLSPRCTGRDMGLLSARRVVGAYPAAELREFSDAWEST